MLKIGTSVLLGSLCFSCFSAESEDPFSFGVRLRSEHVEVAGDHAAALTLKLRGQLEHRFSDSVSALIQIDHVESYWEAQHSNGVVRINEPVIADPQGTEVNQANLSYTFANSELVLGRQSIAMGDHRFVGDVGFRQNDQTYDGVRITHEAIGGWKLDYAYVAQVNRVFGDDAGTRLSRKDIRFDALGGRRPTAQLGKHDTDAHLIRLEGDVTDYVKWVGFAHAVHNSDHAAFSNRTVGVSADFRYKLGAVKWQGEVILARQNRQNLDGGWTTFQRWDFGFEKRPWTVSLRQERFGANRGQAFITPLATLHKFQGWTDQFLNTPGQGLVDSSVQVVWRKRPYTVDIRFHRFDTDRGSDSIGREWNADLIFTPNRSHEIKLRFADFEPESSDSIRNRSVRKVFAMYSYKI